MPLIDVKITNTLVYARKGVENTISDSYSKIGTVYPSKNENIDLRIIKEE